MDRVIILDSTLRDGDQAAGAAFKPLEKSLLARQLESLNVDIIEAGFPAASNAEFHAVKQISSEIRDCRVSAFARGTKRDIIRAGEALRHAAAPRIEIAIPVSDIHISRQLHKSREEIIEVTESSVCLARRYVDDVQWIGVDSTRSEWDFLAHAMESAIRSGASTVSIADTVGFTTPSEMHALVTYLKDNVVGIDKVILSVHCHDDLGLATVNSLSALLAGAREVQCTVNGLGERAGNAALEEIVMAIRVRNNVYPFEIGVDTRKLMATSRMVREMSGFQVAPNKAIVGDNAFTHGSGMHQDALLKATETFQIFNPATVGATDSRIVIGPHSGRYGLRYKLRSLGYIVEDEALNKAFLKVKELSVGRKILGDDELSVIGREFGVFRGGAK